MMGGRTRLRAGLLAMSLAALAACEPTAPITSPTPAARPERAAPEPESQSPTTRSQTSYELARYYKRVQADLLTQGLLRTDGGGPDTPFAAHNLANNFVRIALYDEYVSRGGRLVAQQTASRLRRWEMPVRLQMHFGQTIDPAQRTRDSNALASYSRRLRQATGHSIAMAQSNGNFHVLVMHEDDRRKSGPLLRQLVPGIDETAVRTVENMPRETFCLVFAFSRGENPAYTRAVAVIRGEHPDLLRLSCIHEEVAQGMGLANDSPKARPSIFNDDEEFALLTTHDELLLRILYDRRLRTGMDATEARPTVTLIANELMGGT
ncbi:DUF2927 domain-containing protein [Tropicimonas sp. TH_r6]|uniref:DUF2927 domain-containing protein n=1 Tax=Tropicimonas sp. TH_r6 TaxID=3082085 RepID=UPI0029536A18|nr:DUF2927 domain-containing protein [Tropicimonas sp. TH_r6]MDV7141656.1 DUF2927 domain-containing protein [Tropicimonas sp. TH_r6]